MDRYFKYFRIPFILTAVVAVVCSVIYFNGKQDMNIVRNNSSYDNRTCVYDYAGKLDKQEVAALNDLLVEIEELDKVDIAYVIIRDDDNAYLSLVQEYAQNFAISNNMGYEGPGESTIVFVDNWSRGGDGKIHSWIASRGNRIRSKLTNDECDSILYELDNIPSDESDPYAAYTAIAYDIHREIDPNRKPFGVGIIIIVALVIAGIYVAVNWKSKLGDNTVVSSTYLKSGSVDFPVKHDLFRNKVVTKRKIETSSSSSGGGGGGGGSFGGGGHSR